MSRRVAINLVVFCGVFAYFIYWAVTNIVSFEFVDRPYRISGEFAATAGVAENSEVTYLGVHYGNISGVELIDERVRVEMRIDRGKEIPAGSTARIFRKSAVGEPYIDFVPPADYEGEDGPVIEPGDVIPIEQTTVPLEFSELLRSASRVVSGIDPEDTRILIHELALTLDGRSDSLRQLAVATDDLTSTFAERTDQLDRLTDNNTRLTEILADHRGSLGGALTNLRELAASLRAAEGDTSVLLDRGTDLVGRAADLVGDSKADLDCLLHDLDDVVLMASSDEQLENLRATLQRVPEGLNFVFLSRDDDPDGVWVRTNLLVNPENPPPQYVPPRELPEVPAVPACASTLSSSGLRFRPLPGAGGIAGGNLPATGGQPLLALGVLLAAGAVAAEVTRRQLKPEST